MFVGFQRSSMRVAPVKAGGANPPPFAGDLEITYDFAVLPVLLRAAADLTGACWRAVAAGESRLRWCSRQSRQWRIMLRTGPRGLYTGRCATTLAWGAEPAGWV